MYTSRLSKFSDHACVRQAGTGSWAQTPEGRKGIRPVAIVGHKLSHAVYATYSVQVRKGYASRMRGPAAVREEEAERAITTEVEHRRAQLAGLMAPFWRHLNARGAAAEPSREAEVGRRRGEEEGS